MVLCLYRHDSHNIRFSLLINSRCGPIDKALELLQLDHTSIEEEQQQQQQSGQQGLRITKYITKTFPLSQADQAIQCAAEKSTMKVQIICNE
jgi:hypothetical protein